MVVKFLFATILAQILIFASNVAAAPNIVDKPVLWNAYREQLTLEYAELHYGKSITTIEPQAVVVHWTAGPTWESAYYTFYGETRGDGSGTVNVSSQFIVDRDGTIYRLMPENKLAHRYRKCRRHG